MGKKTVIIAPKDDIMLKMAPTIDALCAPLKKLNITFFSHSRIFNNGTRIDLNNDANMTEQFYFNKAQLYEGYTPEIEARTITDNVMLLDNLGDNDTFQFLREGHNIDHMLVKIEKYDDYCDVWNFGTTRDNHHINQVYTNNLDMLTLFTYYYRERCHREITQFEQDPITIKAIDTAKPGIEGDEQSSEFYSLMEKVERFYLGGMFRNQYLTRREMECCYWLYHGKTNEEIAYILNCSKKTIDRHFENMFNKLGCYNRIRLLQIVTQMGLFSKELRTPTLAEVT